jgi:hypothetical protein
MPFNIYRISAAMKDETDIITGITVSTIRWPVIMYVVTIKAAVIVFVCNVIM